MAHYLQHTKHHNISIVATFNYQPNTFGLSFTDEETTKSSVLRSELTCFDNVVLFRKVFTFEVPIKHILDSGSVS